VGGRGARSRVAPALLAVAALLVYVAAVFHADPESATTSSMHDQIHQTASIVAFVLIIIAMFVSSRRFRTDPRWQRLARPTLLWAICTLAALFLTITLNAVDDSLFGLGQRIFIATWLTWLIASAIHARTIANAIDTPSFATESRHAMPA
jgi:fumarate reductase subunit D